MKFENASFAVAAIIARRLNFTKPSADLVVLRGDPSANINDIEKVELVFKDGLGYDPARLIDSVRGSVGWR